MPISSATARFPRAPSIAACAAVFLGLTFSGLALALEWNLQPAASRLAAEIQDLHEYVMILCAAIFVGVFGFMFWSVYAHRKSKGHQAEEFHEHTTVEMLWTAIPALILVLIAWPATRLVVAQKDTTAADLTIKVTGIQWKWAYDYLKGEGEGISLISTLSTPREQIEGHAPKGEHYLLEVDNELVVPVNRKIRMITTAADVVHSWWVPAFGAKQDAIPGFLRDTWFRAEKTGVFRGQCAELCGRNHANMVAHVRAVSPADFEQYLASKKAQIEAADAAAAGSRAKLERNPQGNP